MPINHVSPNWGHDVEQTKRHAIALFDLTHLGWQGFNQLDWAAALLAKYESIPVILIASFTGAQASFDALEALAAQMSEDDRHRFRDYLVGRLALEELSCRRNGPGAGACESRAALHRCVEICLNWK